MKNVTLGSEYKDTVTGFVGTATAECAYLGQNATVVRLENGSMTEHWFTSTRLVSE